ncbi:MAG TPA: hypothetical protein VH138_14560 [Vicinamibacterales bacterium]|jgi:hypothetical protein|nr:hypothetical protein [Vicinamibacterales bacterium]
MITIPLSLLLERNVTLETDEAVALVQSVVSSGGVPSPENIEIDTSGVARCRSTRGQPTVPALASLLHRLLPATGVAAALRYTVARGIGAVEAPPFSSVQDFSHALSRFERRDRAAVIQGLLSRARPVRTTMRSTPPIARPIRRSWLRPALYGAAGLSISALAGFDVNLVRLDRLARVRVSTPSAVVPPPSLSATSGVALGAPVELPLSTDPGLSTAPARPAHQTAHRNAATIPLRPVRALPATDTAAFSPAFSSEGTALFFQTGGTHDPSSAIAVARSEDGPAADLRIMTIVDDGARNYHAQPSPDGRMIAFDSDRDGVRGVYLADRDGTHVRRISGEGYAALPSWSPDGSRLAVVRAEPDAPSVWNIWIQPTAGGAAQRVTRYRYGQTWTASWFPDGHRIAYSHEDELTILDLTTSQAQHFATPVHRRLVRTPAVSPDGSRVVFQVFRFGVWMLNVHDGSMECVLADPTAEEFAWAPDGHRFAFHSRRDGEWGIYVVTTSATAP